LNHEYREKEKKYRKKGIAQLETRVKTDMGSLQRTVHDCSRFPFCSFSAAH
jgi:hypothetical protein